MQRAVWQWDLHLIAQNRFLVLIVIAIVIFIVMVIIIAITVTVIFNIIRY